MLVALDCQQHQRLLDVPTHIGHYHSDVFHAVVEVLEDEGGGGGAGDEVDDVAVVAGIAAVVLHSVVVYWLAEPLIRLGLRKRDESL